MESGILASRIYSKQELCLLEQIPEPCAIVIFGASGDLAERKLFPSLFHLALNGLMPRRFHVLGVARTHMTDEAFRDKVRRSLPSSAQKEAVEKFLANFHYLSGDYSSPKLYFDLGKILQEWDTRLEIHNRRVFYLSTPPSLYATIVKELGVAGLARRFVNDKDGWVRVIVEKPFGHSLASAKQLNKDIKGILTERQIYRIDHYLGKETAQNIIMFRFANILFEPVWNRNFIDHIQITAAEQLGVEHRAGYYEQVGVLRDMFQNHLLQLMALIAMEPPTSLEAEAVRNKREDVLEAVRCLTPVDLNRHVVCAQYGAGKIGGKEVPGYRQEKGVDPQSRVPTFATFQLAIDNWRWEGVPFYLKSGKRLAERLLQISIHFKRIPVSIFKPLLAEQLSPNILVFRIQPNEGITMTFEAKHPGPKLCMSTVTMNFGYEQTFKTPLPEAYARLFQDAMLGDQTLFARSDSVEQSWRIMDPIIEYWESNTDLEMPIYPAGSWGPNEASDLLERSGRSWY